MKTGTKILIAALSLSAAVLLGSSFSRSGEGSKYVTMRIMEHNSKNSTIVIVYEDSRVEELELGAYGNILPNSVKINKAINSIASKGYELVSSSGGDYITTYTFVKK